MEHLNELYDLCETVSNEIAEANEKIKMAGGKLSGADVDYIDKLTHTLKSLKTTIAMVEADDDGYSSRYPDYPMRESYARKRDSRGRYSRDYRYYRDGDMMTKLHEAMEEAPDEKTKADIKRLIDKMA